ncbi:hypothetical protein [Flavobacterium endophyticum]|nr:hypothetical protein [Flavobacterium endophyticum]
MKKQNVIIVTVVSLFFSLFIVSCKENLNKEKETINKKTDSLKTFKNDIVEFDFDFPDTIYINKIYNGKINYRSVLDTITTTFDNEQKSRYILFYMKRTKSINYKIEELKKMKLDTFGATDNRTIPIYGIKFTELGVHYLDGIINDHIAIDTLISSKKPNDKVRYIENEVRATHKVIVVEQ